MNKSTISAMIIAVGAILFFMFVLPKYDELSGLRKTVTSRSQLLADTQAAKTNLEKLAKEYEANKNISNQVALAVPDRRGLDYITNSMQMAVAATGMQLTNITISDAPKTVTDFQTIQVKAEITGSYPNFLSLLDALEHSLRIYDITKLTVASQQTGVSQFTLQFITYSLK